MNIHLQIDRPIIFFDLETTGTDITNDRIVEIAVLKINPDGTQEKKVKRLNPTISIPAEAAKVHGITDEDVKDAPTFSNMAGSLSKYFENCDLAGYNLIKFDIPLLVEEFLRVGVKVPFDENTKIIDAMKIFYKQEPRNLPAALQFYCGEEHTEAHAALADVEATKKVLLAQIEKYQLQPTTEELHNFCSDDKTIVDYAQKFIRNEQGTIVFNFGKNKGLPVKNDPMYLQWMLGADFPRHTKHIIKQILHNKLS